MMAAWALLAMAQPAEPPPRAQLGEIRLHLFYQGSGRVSRDISPPAEFIGWNTVIGEGSAEEPADDLLAVVEIRADGHHFLERPLTISATGRDGRRIAERTVGGLLTGTDGRTYIPLWIPGVGCEGGVRVTATFDGETQSETVELNCGE